MSLVQLVLAGVTSQPTIRTGERMIHLESVLVYDIPPIVAAVGSVMAAKIGLHNKAKIDEVNEAVNGNPDPQAPTLKEQVTDVKEKVENK